MGNIDSSHAAAILDRMISEKEISAAFFGRIAESLSDVDQRRWFRRLGQDEKDQRKILLKHRRSICGPPTGLEIVPVSAVHTVIHQTPVVVEEDLVDALRLAVRSAESSRNFYVKSSDLMTDRSCRIFLKILGEESEGHRRTLIAELRREERELVGTVEDMAA